MRMSMSVQLDAPFEIELKSKGSSGFEWRPNFDPDALTLLGRRQIPNIKKMGASGKVIFRFQPRLRGDYEIDFALMRSWEEEMVEHRKFLLHVE